MSTFVTNRVVDRNIITGQTAIDSLTGNDTFLVHDASSAALRSATLNQLTNLVQPPQPVGSVIQTNYAELVGRDQRTGSTIPRSTTTFTTNDGHFLLSATHALTSPGNYLIITGNMMIDSDQSRSDGPGGVVLLFAGSNLILSKQTYGITYNGANMSFVLKYQPPNTNSIVYSVRAAVDGGTLLINHDYGDAVAVITYNTGLQRSTLLIQEIKG
jgi:hypothetical protein